MAAGEEWKIGTIIKNIREEQNVSLEALSYGLCSPTTLRRIENNERDMKMIFFAALFERLGYYPDGIELYVGEEEYERFEQRRRIRKTEREKDFSGLQKMLEKYKTDWEKEIDAEPLEQQFVSEIVGHLLLEEQKYEASIKMFEKALQITVPCWYTEKDINYMAGETELRLMSRIADVCEKLGRKKETYEIRKTICNYLEKTKIKLNQIVELYTGVVVKLVPQMMERGQAKKALALCSRAETALSERGRLYHWDEILYQRAQCLRYMWEKGIGDRAEVMTAYRKSYFIFRLLGNPEMAASVKNYLDKEKPGWLRINLDKL